eukprot:4449195-Prymnesium_polylepis.2
MSHTGLPPTDTFAQGLQLLHGHTYRLVATALNGVGLSSPPCVSTDVVVDMTSPVAGIVRVVHSDVQAEEEPDFEARFQFSTQVIRFAPTGFEDPESDLEGYYVSVQRSDGWILAREVRIGVKPLVALPARLRHGQRFTVTVRAMNFAEDDTIVESNLVQVDTTPPVINYVADYVQGTAEVDFVGALDLDVVVLFSAFDHESGIKSATWFIGTFPGADD